MGDFAIYLASFAALAAAIWAATEGMGRALNVPKDVVAFVLGLLGGPVLYGSGFIVDPAAMRVPWMGWVLSVFAGLLATFAAGQLNDRLVKRFEEEKKP